MLDKFCFINPLVRDVPVKPEDVSNYSVAQKERMFFK